MNDRDSPQPSSSSANSASGALPALLDSRLRHLGCSLLTSTAHLLGLPTTTTLATAHVLLHRFLSAPSFSSSSSSSSSSSASASASAPLRKHSLRDITLAALFLACKVEETQVSIKSLVSVFHHVLTTWQSAGADPTPDPIRIGSPEYTDLEHALLKSEMYLLKALGFDVHVDHAPDVYLWLMHYVRALNLVDARHVAQRAWDLANDSFRVPLALYFPPHAVAAGCVELAVRRAQVAVPEGWAEIVADVQTGDVEFIVRQLVAGAPEHVPLPVDLPVTVSEIKAWLALDGDELKRRLVPSGDVGADELEARGRARLQAAEMERKRREAREREEEEERKRQAAAAPKPKVDSAAVQAAVAKARAAAAAAATRSSPLASSPLSARDGYRDRERERGAERYRDDRDGRGNRDRERERDRDRNRDRDRDRDRDRGSREYYGGSGSRYGSGSSSRSSSRDYRR